MKQYSWWLAQLRIVLGSFFLITAFAVSSCTKKTETREPLSSEVDTKSSLNDTGIQFGGDYPLGLNQNCSGTVDPEHVWTQKENFSHLSYKGQDCEMGRDVDFPDPSDGHAGFSYQKISASGKPLQSSDKTWSCVTDIVTGLMWEVKSLGNDIKGDGGLHDADDTFSWYSNNWELNGGHVGHWGRENNSCSFYRDGDPSTYCNTESYVARVNKESLCSYSDWRIPNIDELSSLVNFGVTEPSIDKQFFPNTQNAPYWSGSLIAVSNMQARYVNFRFGQIIWSVREEPYRVRLVRSTVNR